MPAASLRIIPALSISLWLTSSASAGVSFSVWRWNCDRRIGGINEVARPLIVPCSTGLAAAAAALLPPAVDFDALAGLDVDLLEAPAVRRRILGHLDHAGGVGPAIEHGTRVLGVGRGGLLGALALGCGGFGRLAREPPGHGDADGKSGKDGPAGLHGGARTTVRACSRP